MLKDDPGFTKLKWFSQFRLKTPLEKFSSRNDLTLKSTGVTLPSVETGKIPLDYIPFKRITKDSSYYRRILLLNKPKGATTYKSKMEKRLSPMLNSGMIPLQRTAI